MSAVAAAAVAPAEALLVLDAALDLADVRRRLAKPGDGAGFTAEQLDVMEAEYRRFLALQLADPDAAIVPCKLVDTIWHEHVLDTAAYRADCASIFGRFIDHDSNLDTRGDDVEAMHDAYVATIERYREAFGEPDPDTWLSADASRDPKPGTCKAPPRPQGRLD